MHMVEAVRGDSFILLQSNSPFAYQACCLWEGGEDYVSQKWGCANLIVFVERRRWTGGRADGERQQQARSPALEPRTLAAAVGSSHVCNRRCVCSRYGYSRTRCSVE